MSQADDSRNQRLEQVLAEYLRSVEAGQPADREQFLAKYPDLAGELQSFFANRDALQRLVPPDQASERTLSVTPRGSAVPSASVELVRLIESYVAELQAGRRPDRKKLLEEHPELARELAACLDGLDFVHRAQAGEVGRLGDFRIVREVGRGGMGVVYEAEQISLRRKVALKVLKIGGIADEAALGRFQREAETVAHLHHTNIVPIFAVGCEGGVHYYAMQFIEGRSLDSIGRPEQGGAVPAGKPVCNQPELRGLVPAYGDIARWCGEAAEALAHAHQRGVIHRDVKPSNLLLDADGRIWLTDFGLARRAAEATLTMTGAMMGTPRYMSPEQVRAVQNRIDHRTDIYSLGATLYELATGRPAFDADSPHVIVRKILDVEPAAPRSIRPDLPRDLETIILKCLAKNAAERYPTARELADDLRRFVSGDPIRARRTTALEHAVRWAKKQRRSAVVAVVAAAAACVLAVSSVAWWNARQAADLAGLKLKTDGPKLRADVLDARTGSRVARFTVPTEEPQKLPAGEYRVRLSGEGQLSETFAWTATRRKTDAIDVTLTDRLRWQTPRGLHREVLGTNILIVTGPKRLQWLDGSTGKPVWEVSLDWTDQPLLAKLQADAKARKVELIQAAFQVQPEEPSVWRYDLTPQTVPTDVDGDSTPDLLIASTHSPALVAVSGRDGKLLWVCLAEPDLPEGIDPAKIHQHDPFDPSSHLLGQPLLATVDGRPVVVCVWWVVPSHVWYFDDKRELQSRWDHQPQIWAEAIATRDGQVVWRRRLPKAGEYHLTPPVMNQIVPHDDGDALAIVVGSQLLGLRLQDGERAWEDRSLGTLVRPPQFVDLDGDGRKETLACEQYDGERTGLVLVDLSNSGSSFNRDPTGSAEGSGTLNRHPSPPVGSRLDVLETPPQPGGRETLAAWFPPPLPADLNGDKQVEFLVARWPDSVSKPQDGYNPAQQVSLAAVSADGTTLWQRTLRTADERLARFIVGADLDRDGWLDVYAVTIGPATSSPAASPTPVMFLDVLGGRDGRTLGVVHWEPGIPVRYGYDMRDDLFRLQWVPTADDSPRLAVTVYASKYHGASPNATALIDVRALTRSPDQPGEVQHYGELATADLDGDGWGELLFAQGEQLRVLRGSPPDGWRRLASVRPRRPAADLDGDGVADVLSPAGDPLAAISSRDGRTLWSRPADPFAVPLPPHGDLDGDGVADLVSLPGGRERRLAAISGRSGRLLWQTALPLPPADSVQLQNEQLGWADVTKLDSDGDAVLFAVPIAADNRRSIRFFLGCVAAKDGRVRWLQPMSDSSAGNEHMRLRPTLADVNGDGVCDVVCLVPNHTGSPSSPGGVAFWEAAIELRAYNGRDGAVFWKRVLAEKQQRSRYPTLWSVDVPRPLIADLDADGSAQVLLTAVVDERHAEVLALSGRDGQPKWTWRGDDADQFSNGPQWQYASPQLLRRASGWGVVLCIHDVVRTSELVDAKTGSRRGIPNKSAVEVVVLDAHGQPVARRDIQRGNRVPVHVADIDGDGRDEVLVTSGDKLLALDADLATVRWEWPRVDRTEHVSSLSNGQAILIGQRRWYGVSLASGKTVWHAETTPQLRQHSFLAAFRPNVLPSVITWRHGVEIAAPVVARDVETARTWAKEATDGFDETMRPTRDPRWERPLPWAVRPAFGPPMHVAVIQLVTFSVSLALGFVAWLRRKERRTFGVWGAASLLFLLLVVQPLLLLALLTLIAGALQIAHRRWLSLIRSFLGWLLLSGLIAALWLAWDLRRRLPEEWYSTSGWPMPLLHGAALLGLLLVLRTLFRVWRKAARQR